MRQPKVFRPATSVRLKPRTEQRLRAAAQRNGVSVSAFVRDAISQFVWLDEWQHAKEESASQQAAQKERSIN